MDGFQWPVFLAIFACVVIGSQLGKFIARKVNEARGADKWGRKPQQKKGSGVSRKQRKGGKK